jgi:hypothetical protein
MGNSIVKERRNLRYNTNNIQANSAQVNGAQVNGTTITAASMSQVPTSSVNMYVCNMTANPKVSDADVQIMVSACNLMIKNVASAWNLLCPTITFISIASIRSKVKTVNDWLFYMIDTDQNVPDAAAYHTEVSDMVVGYILVRTIITQGGTVPISGPTNAYYHNPATLFYKDASTLTVASALSHEIFEALIDAFCVQWWQGQDGNFYAAEVCDPVQGNIIKVAVNGVNVGVSNFVLRAWQDTESKKGPYDYMGLLKAPFTLNKNGYAVVFDPNVNQVNYVFGDLVPEWVKQMKAKSLRLLARNFAVGSDGEVGPAVKTKAMIAKRPKPQLTAPTAIISTNIPYSWININNQPGVIMTMPSIRMYINNKSTLVSSVQVNKMVEACNILLPEVAKSWGVNYSPVTYAGAPPKPSETDWVFNIIDTDPNNSGFEAFHTVEGGLVDGYIMAKPTLDYGGTILYGGKRNHNQPTIAASLFHEIVEALGDPECNAWWKNSSGTINSFDQNGNPITTAGAHYVACEICDPVQMNVVAVTLRDGKKVGLSDFVLPSWSDVGNRVGPFNYLNTLKAPFTIDLGGYVVYKDSEDGTQNQAYGVDFPEWMKDLKKRSGRNNCRRVGGGKGRMQKLVG